MSHKLSAAAILAVFLVQPASAQPLARRSDPAKGFDPRAVPKAPGKAMSPAGDAGGVNPASPVLLLPQHGNSNGGVDHGLVNAGVIFGARVYSANLAQAVELFYYLPSRPDNYYREGDYRASTGRIGGNSGTDNGEYYCPDGYAAVGLEGAAGLAIDRVGLVCGQIGNLSKAVSLPVFGGSGGNPFYDNCSSTASLGFLTGVRVRSGAWMDSIQGLCQAAGGTVSEAAPAEPKPAEPKAPLKLADDLASTIAVGANRSDVLQKLGEPSSRISGDFERFTYQLQSGGTLRIEFEDGRVAKVQTTGAR